MNYMENKEVDWTEVYREKFKLSQFMNNGCVQFGNFSDSWSSWNLDSRSAQGCKDTTSFIKSDKRLLSYVDLSIEI